jgi:hypothetical protein
MNRFLQLAFCVFVFFVLILACTKQSGENNDETTDNPSTENLLAV